MSKTALQLLVTAIIADGLVDAAETSQLTEAVYADGVVDRDEAKALFEINNAVTGKENDPGFGDLFVKAIASSVLEDETSPGVIDKEEGDWLAAEIGADGETDALETRLLIHISDNAKSIESDALNALIEKVKANV